MSYLPLLDVVIKALDIFDLISAIFWHIRSYAHTLR